jgi:hypothetical protein
MTPGQLSLASNKPALAAYLKHNPKCCSAESEFDPRYWDYLWTVKFYLRGYVNDQPREEYEIISVSACGYYDEMNWTSDY